MNVDKLTIVSVAGRCSSVMVLFIIGLFSLPLCRQAVLLSRCC